MWIAGIDPGNQGAIAFLEPEKHVMRIVDMPIFEWETTRKRKKVDAYQLRREFVQQPMTHLYMEEVWSSPQMGVVSAFSFGNGRGIVEGMAAGLELPITQIKPRQWKKDMIVPADKKAAVKRATELLPDVGHMFKGPRGGLYDGRAEAAILALYGAFQLGWTMKSSIKYVNEV